MRHCDDGMFMCNFRMFWRNMRSGWNDVELLWKLTRRTCDGHHSCLPRRQRHLSARWTIRCRHSRTWCSHQPFTKLSTTTTSAPPKITIHNHQHYHGHSRKSRPPPKSRFFYFNLLYFDVVRKWLSFELYMCRLFSKFDEQNELWRFAIWLHVSLLVSVFVNCFSSYVYFKVVLAWERIAGN